jgi:hypothetical protein
VAHTATAERAAETGNVAHCHIAKLHSALACIWGTTGILYRTNRHQVPRKGQVICSLQQSEFEWISGKGGAVGECKDTKGFHQDRTQAHTHKRADRQADRHTHLTFTAHTQGRSDARFMYLAAVSTLLPPLPHAL